MIGGTGNDRLCLTDLTLDLAGSNGNAGTNTVVRDKHPFTLFTDPVSSATTVAAFTEGTRFPDLTCDSAGFHQSAPVHSGSSNTGGASGKAATGGSTGAKAPVAPVAAPAAPAAVVLDTHSVAVEVTGVIPFRKVLLSLRVNQGHSRDGAADHAAGREGARPAREGAREDQDAPRPREVVADALKKGENARSFRLATRQEPGGYGAEARPVPGGVRRIQAPRARAVKVTKTVRLH